MIEHEVVNLTLALLGMGAAVAGLVLVAKRRGQRRELVRAWNGTLVGTHEGAVTRKAQAAISAKHLLGKIGASGDGHVAVAGAADTPLYVITDEAEAAGDRVACEVLGVVGRTVLMRASEEVDAGVLVVPAANGKVRAVPETPGNYQVVGRALTGAGTDGDLVEVASCVAYEVAVAEEE
jgi:hypothetical protein